MSPRQFCQTIHFVSRSKTVNRLYSIDEFAYNKYKLTFKKRKKERRKKRHRHIQRTCKKKTTQPTQPNTPARQDVQRQANAGSAIRVNDLFYARGDRYEEIIQTHRMKTRHASPARLHSTRRMPVSRSRRVASQGPKISTLYKHRQIGIRKLFS